MQYQELGDTQIKVSRLGLGCGGPKRLGLARGASDNDAVRLIELAVSMGINLIDTAAVYRNEAIVGRAIKNMKREDIVLCSKVPLPKTLPLLDTGSFLERIVRETTSLLGRYLTEDELQIQLSHSLRRLNTDYLDVFYLQAVTPDQYPAAITLLPALVALKKSGIIRAIGITESTKNDADHLVITQAVQDSRWDVVMLQPPALAECNVPDYLHAARVNKTGVVAMNTVSNHANSPPANYPAVLNIPGVTAVLCGTSRESHLQNNILAISDSGSANG
jgi:aryl-alcohol dehydrogenase-like predicted oxidoreductase